MNVFIEFYSRLSFCLQIILWLYSCYVTVFISMPHILSIIKYNILRFLVEGISLVTIFFLFICLFRSMYYAFTIKSYITLKDIKNIENNIKKYYLQEEFNNMNNKYSTNNNIELIKECNIEHNYINKSDKQLEKSYKNEFNNLYTYCKKCDSLRHLRDKHCSICNKCTVLFDHHCFILNNCIGNHNFPYFYSYIVVSVFVIFVVTFLNMLSFVVYFIDFIHKRNEDSNNIKAKSFLNTMKIFNLNIDSIILIIFNFPVRAFIVVVISLSALISLTFLNFKYFYLIIDNKTWNENKYNLNYNKDRIKNCEFKLKSFKLFKYLTIYLQNLKKNVLKSNSILDIFYPDI